MKKLSPKQKKYLDLVFFALLGMNIGLFITAVYQYNTLIKKSKIKPQTILITGTNTSGDSQVITWRLPKTALVKFDFAESEGYKGDTNTWTSYWIIKTNGNYILYFYTRTNENFFIGYDYNKKWPNIKK